MYKVLLILFFMVSFLLILFILIQKNHGTDAPAGAAIFSNTIFNTNHADNIITKMITVLAILFFVLSLLLGNFVSNHNKKDSKWDNLHLPAEENTVRK